MAREIFMPDGVKGSPEVQSSPDSPKPAVDVSSFPRIDGGIDLSAHLNSVAELQEQVRKEKEEARRQELLNQLRIEAGLPPIQESAHKTPDNQPQPQTNETPARSYEGKDPKDFSPQESLEYFADTIRNSNQIPTVSDLERLIGCSRSDPKFDEIYDQLNALLIGENIPVGVWDKFSDDAKARSGVFERIGLPPLNVADRKTYEDAFAENLKEIRDRNAKNGEEQETIEIVTQGGRQEIEIPKSAEGKMKMLLDILADMEATRMVNGGAAVRQRLAQMETIISALRNPRYLRNHPEGDLNRTIAEKMSAEFEARVDFHNDVYLKFNDSMSVESVGSAVTTLQAMQVNQLFSSEDFIVMSNFYEQKGEQFKEKVIAGNPILGGEGGFRARAQAYGILRRQEITRLGRLSAADEVRVLNNDAAINDLALLILGGRFNDESLKEIKARQNLAERWWEIEGRRANMDELTDGYPPKFKDEGIQRGGNFMLRRIIRMNDFLRSRIKSHHPRLHLLGISKSGSDELASNYEEIDLKQHDYTWALVDKLKNEGITTDDDGNPLVDGRGRINYLARKGGELLFQNFDFAKMGERPMGGWAYGNLQMPEAVRDFIAGNEEAYIYKPSVEKLYGISKVLEYFGDDMEKVKEMFWVNLMKWSRYERYRDTLQPDFTKQQVEGYAYQAVGLDEEKEVHFLEVSALNKINSEAKKYKRPNLISRIGRSIDVLRGKGDQGEVEEAKARRQIKRRAGGALILAFLRGFMGALLKKMREEAFKF